MPSSERNTSQASQIVTLAAVPVTLEGPKDNVSFSRRTVDDLPPHIKGEAQWRTSLQGFEDQRGYIVSARTQSGHYQDVSVEFIKDLNTDTNNWYFISQVDFPNWKTWFAYLDKKIPIQNKYKLGYWCPTNPDHSEYIVASRKTGPSSQSAITRMESTHTSTLGTQTPAHEGFLSATVSSVAKIQEDHLLTPETQTPELTQRIEAATLARATFEPVPLKFQHLETTRTLKYLDL
jgi:hypothetical protein